MARRMRVCGRSAPHAAARVEVADLRAQRVQVALDDIRKKCAAHGLLRVRPACA